MPKKRKAHLGFVVMVTLLFIVVLGGVYFFINGEKEQQTDTEGKEKITIVYDQVPQEVDVYSLNQQKRLITANVFEGLVQIDRFYRTQPALALSWGVVSSTEWEFKLRRNVHFHNGELLTVDHVLSSLEMARTNGSIEMKNILTSIDKVVKKDDYILRIITKQSDPLLLTKLSILPIVTMDGGEQVGTGPYTLSNSTEHSLLFEKHDMYWGHDASMAKSIEVRGVEDKIDRFESLLQGEIDILATVPVSEENVYEIEQREDIELLTVPGLEMVYLMFQLGKAHAAEINPLAELEIRQALRYAVDLDEIVSFGEGFLKPVNQFIASGIFGYSQEIPKHEYSLEKANALLEDAKFTFSLAVTPDFQVIAEYLQSQLQQVGIDVEFDVIESPTDFLNKLKNRDFQSYIIGWRFDLGDSLNFLSTHMHTPEGAYGEYNGNTYSNSTVDDLIGKAESELDEQTRLQYLQEIQRLLMEDVAGVPLFETEKVFARTTSVNWKPRLDGLILFKEIR